MGRQLKLKTLVSSSILALFIADAAFGRELLTPESSNSHARSLAQLRSGTLAPAPAPSPASDISGCFVILIFPPPPSPCPGQGQFYRCTDSSLPLRNRCQAHAKGAESTTTAAS